MKVESNRTWTVDAIAEIFTKHHDEADEINRELTRGPFQPYGEAFEDLTWFGSIQEAAEDKNWPRLDDVEARADPKSQAVSVIGKGRPIGVAFWDGQFPTVFCEKATEAEVEAAVELFYTIGDSPISNED